MRSKYSKLKYIVLILMTPLLALAQIDEHTISVPGVGQVKVNNDQAFITTQVNTENLDADLALTANNNTVQNVITELNNVGITMDQITTTNFSFQPNYRWEDGGYHFIGYVVTNGLRVEVNEINSVGSILNLLVDAGVSRVTGVSFGGSELAELRQQALVKATEDAKLKAQILADATDVTLGPVIKINLHSGSNMIRETAEADMGAISAQPVPISPGSNTIRETVNITYLIVD